MAAKGSVDSELEALMASLGAPSAAPAPAPAMAPLSARSVDRELEELMRSTQPSLAPSSAAPGRTVSMRVDAELQSLLAKPAVASTPARQEPDELELQALMHELKSGVGAQPAPAPAPASAVVSSAKLGAALDDLLSDMGAPPPHPAMQMPAMPVAPPIETLLGPPPEAPVPVLPPVPADTSLCGCGAPVTHGQVMNALGRKWHPPCFKCYLCGISLLFTPFFQHEGRPLCQNDFGAAFSPKCASCRNAIVGPFMNALNRKWHAECFVCRKCGCNFPGGQFFERGGWGFCPPCFQQNDKPTCGKCLQPIDAGAVQAFGKHFHQEHFSCFKCSKTLVGASYAERGGWPHCSDCIDALSKNVCAVCLQPIDGGAINASGKRFHPHHFACSVCNTDLNGEAFEWTGKALFCTSCWSAKVKK